MAGRGLGRRAAAVATAALAALAGPLTASCDEVVVLENAAPRVTWVAVEPAAGEHPDFARIVVWLHDVEGDSVDLEVSWDDGADPAPLAFVPGGHGTVGLPTREALFDPNGQPHELRWDVEGLSGSGRLVFTPDDRIAPGPGETVRSPEFDLAAGLPDVVLLEPAP